MQLGTTAATPEQEGRTGGGRGERGECSWGQLQLRRNRKGGQEEERGKEGKRERGKGSWGQLQLRRNRKGGQEEERGKEGKRKGQLGTTAATPEQEGRTGGGRGERGECSWGQLQLRRNRKDDAPRRGRHTECGKASVVTQRAVADMIPWRTSFRHGLPGCRGPRQAVEGLCAAKP